MIELTRLFNRKKPRTDWRERWNAAGNSVHWLGALVYGVNKEHPMIADEESPIWMALAKGTGGFRDATGFEKPPFAYNSGLAWRTFGSQSSLAANALAAARHYIMDQK